MRVIREKQRSLPTALQSMKREETQAARKEINCVLILFIWHVPVTKVNRFQCKLVWERVECVDVFAAVTS